MKGESVTLVFRIDEAQPEEAHVCFTIAQGYNHPQDRVSGPILLLDRLLGRPRNVR